jgi:mannose/fructose/N-acetylgalactosamine-specific phosphotransferase system component IID
MANKKKTEKDYFFSSFIRSFFVQAAWNFERMQNVGFAYVILPLIRGLYPEKGDRLKVIQRHLGFFNTHPYMVGVILGIVADMEKDRFKENKVTEEEIILIKTNMAGPLAAIGDTFFWATWKPFSHKDNFQATWMPPLLFLFLFNIVHLPFRYWSMWLSYHYRARSVKILASFKFQKLVSILRNLSLVLLALMFIYYLSVFSNSSLERVICGLILGLSVLFSFLNVPPVVIFYGTVASACFLAYFNIIIF